MEHSRRVQARVPASLRDFASGAAATQGLVIPVGHFVNGNTSANIVGNPQPVNDFSQMGNVIQNAMGSIGAQIQTNLQNLTGTDGQGVAAAVAGIANQAAQNVLGNLTPQPSNSSQQSAPPPSGPAQTGQNQNDREHAATLSASIVSMISRPTDADGNPTDCK